MKKVSVVIPVFNESKNISLLFDELNSVFALLQYDKEYVFVNDGSRDDSLIILRDLSEKNSFVKVLSLSRNFGHQAALTAGIDVATGDAVITMDCDLQDPPSVIAPMLEKWEAGAKIVYGRRISRKDSFLKKWTANWYYKILYRASDIKIMGNIADFRLIDGVVAGKLRQMKERTRYLRGLVPWLGYKHDVVDYERPKRKHGETGFSMLKMMRFAMAGILNFSLLPLRLGLIIGVFIIFSGFVFLIYLAIRYFFDDQFYKLLEWLAVVNYILIGFLFILLWILGEYIGKIYDETKGRPLYIVDETMNLEGK